MRLGSSYDSDSMKPAIRLLCAVMLCGLLCASLQAQAPVYSLPQHDLPYLYITLGAADIINAIVGKPELHQILQDGETHYSPGHFAHVARTDSGVPFHNITIELIHPQGIAKNLCKDVLPGQPVECP